MAFTSIFQEWVTDNPFVISPRITFEVSVRLLGGLMALGYTIASILKRSSHVFSDDRVSVKIDWLEQVNRHYVQVPLYFCTFIYFLLNNQIGFNEYCKLLVLSNLCLGMYFNSL